MRTIALLFAAIALGSFTMIGCEKKIGDGAIDKTATSDKGGDHGDHVGHDHADEEHAHGPNGGHPFKFAEGDYQGEWKHYGDNHVIRVYILDSEGKKNVPVVADSVTITRLTGEDAASFTLDPDSPNGQGETAVFTLDDQDLAIAMNLKVKIEMKVGDKTYTCVIAEHQPHDH